MARFAKAALSLALTAGMLTAAPAGAVSVLAGTGLPARSPSLSDAAQKISDKSDKNFKAPGGAEAVTVVPAPVGWLMMLVGFGLLGAMNRRSNSDLLRDEMVP